MRHRRGLGMLLATLASVGFAAGFAACSSNGSGVKTTRNTVDGATSTGGATGADGATSVGGATSMGGATGGSPTAGGSLGTGGAIATGGTTSSTSGPTEGGYFVSGDWHGYAWTSAWFSTIDPSDFSANTTGFPFCATGTAVLGGNSYAEIGFNINQAQGQNTPVGTWQPTTVGIGGVVVNASNPGGSTLFVELTVPGTTNYWATIGAFDQDVLIPWTTFNTISDQSGSAYAGQPIQDIDVSVPGGTITTTYSFCVNSITIDTSTIAPPVTCAAPPQSQLVAPRISGWLSCGGVSCSTSYPYYCSQTNKCYPTQAAAAAACGSTPCVACVAVTCQCSCTCNNITTTTVNSAYTTCEAGLQGGCSDCCFISCSNLRFSSYSASGPSSCTALP